MCIMTVKAGARYTTCTQALAHNLDTVAGDATMLIEYVSAHNIAGINRQAHVDDLRDMLEHIRQCQHTALELWREAMCQDCQDDAEHMGIEAMPDHMHYQPRSQASIALDHDHEATQEDMHPAHYIERFPNQHGPWTPSNASMALDD